MPPQLDFFIHTFSYFSFYIGIHITYNKPKKGRQITMDKFILVTIIKKAWQQRHKTSGKVIKEGISYAYTNTQKKTIETFGMLVTKNVTLKGEDFNSNSNDDAYTVFNWFPDSYDEDYHKDFVATHCNGNLDEPQFYYHPETDEYLTIDEFNAKYPDASVSSQPSQDLI